jgi:hypothetical protein
MRGRILIQTLFMSGALGLATPAPAQDPAPMDMEYGEEPPAVVTVDSVHRAVWITVGPYVVGGTPSAPSAYAMGHGHVIRCRWPVDGFLHGYSVTVHDSLGRLLSMSMLHHAGIANLGRRDLLMPQLQRLVAAGRETHAVELPASIGVPLRTGDSLAVYVGVHGASAEQVEGAYVIFRLSYTPASRHRPPVTVWPVTFAVNFAEGASAAFDLAPGITTRSAEFVMPVSGRLLAAGGHVHDFARSIGLVDCASGKTLVLLHPHRRKDGTVTGLSRFVFGFNDDALRLERGHCYRVVVVYDNPTGRTIAAGGMGYLGGPLQVDDMAGWPAIEPVREKIAIDLRTM